MLPSNGSLHEDLILEELEVFQVSSASLPPLTDVTSSSAKSGRGWVGGWGGAGAEPTVGGGVPQLGCCCHWHRSYVKAASYANTCASDR